MTEDNNLAAANAVNDTQTEHAPTQEELKIAEQAEQLAAMQEQIEQLKLQVAVANIKKPNTEPLGLGKLDVKREQARRAAGSNAAWHALSPEDRAAVQGVTERYTDEEIKEVFGKGSDAMKAQRLATTNPTKYARMRVVAIERNLY